MPAKHDIAAAIAAVEKIHSEALAAFPMPATPSRYDDDWWEARRVHVEAGRAAVQRLVEEYGATAGRSGGDADRLKLAGVSTSCTSGDWGLMTNWLAAARRKLAKSKGA